MIFAQESGNGHGTGSTVESGGAHNADTAPDAKIRHRASSYDRGVQIAAARLRLVTDSRLGLETPAWVKELAAEKPGSRAQESGHRAESGGAHNADTAPDAKIRHRASSYDRGVQIAAARLRLVTDSRLGLETPAWVKELAAEKPGSRAP